MNNSDCQNKHIPLQLGKPTHAFRCHITAPTVVTMHTNIVQACRLQCVYKTGGKSILPLIRQHQYSAVGSPGPHCIGSATCKMHDWNVPCYGKKVYQCPSVNVTQEALGISIGNRKKKGYQRRLSKSSFHFFWPLVSTLESLIFFFLLSSTIIDGENLGINGGLLLELPP